MERERKPLAQGDAYADKIVVRVYDNGVAVNLYGVGVSAKAVRYDGVTVPLVGSVEYGAACVVLDKACYEAAGDVRVSVAISAGDMVQTVLVLLLNVETGETGIVADNGVIGDLTSLLAEIANLREATNAALDAVNRVDEAAPPIVVTQSGAVAEISDAVARPAQSVVSTINVQQTGTGTPSESNLRPIVTASNLALYHGVAYDETAAPAYTMELPEGVYGGRYDWISGKLEITYGVIRLAGSDRTWQLGYGNHYTAIPGRAEKAMLYSDRYVQIANPEGIKPGEMALGARNNNVCFGTDLSLDDWKAKLDAQPLEVVYELAEPVVVQLEPTRIVMLDGDNALWSDTGDTEVAYIVDTKEYVDSVAGTGGGAVQSVNGKIGKVVLTAADVGALDKDAEIVDVTARKGVDALSEEKANKLNAAAYGLSMLYLKGDIAGMSKDNAVTLDYEYKGRQGTCEVKWQGSSSLQWPKKNYTIKFDEAFEAVEGWGDQRKYCFKANFIDHSHARNIGSCKLWGELVKSRGLHSTTLPHATNPWGYADYYTYKDGVYTALHSAAVSGKGRYCINGFTLPAGRYDMYLDVFMPSGGADRQVIASAYAPDARNAFALTRPTKLDEWESVALEGIDASNFTSPCHISIQGRETEGMKFRNVVVKNTATQEEIALPAPAWQIKDLPNGGAIDGFPCVIMLNGEFHGLYTWNIPKDGWMLGTPKAILCADLHCDATKFKALATLDGDFELEYVEDEDNADWVLPSLNRAIQSVIDSNGGDLDTVVGQYIDISSAIDYYIHTVDESAADGTSKNYLLFTFDGVKWYFGAYDRDTTYGLYWDGKNFYSPAFASVTYAGYANHHALMNLIYTHKKAALKSRAIELRDGIKSAANVATVFSNFVKDIPSQVLDEDARKWPTIPSTSASNLAQIQSWYIIRRQIIDKEIDAMA